MINNATESRTQLKQFFLNQLEELNIPDLIFIDTNSTQTYLNSIVINNSNLKKISLPNLVQSPYVLKGDNLTEINLDSLNRIEFGNDYLANRYANFLPLSILQNTKIQTLELPNFVGTGAQVPPLGNTIDYAMQTSFRNNYWLKSVSLGNNLMNASDNTSFIFNGYWFLNNYFLVALCLNYPYVININRRDSFSTTPIGNGNGHIYVPTQELKEAYENHQIWGALPMGTFQTLNYYNTYVNAYEDTLKNETWADIIANCNNHNTGHYNIGDTKTLYIDNTPIQMVIVAKGKDELADNSGYASLTWMEKTISRFERLDLTSTFSGPINFHNSSSSNPQSYLGYRDLFTNLPIRDNLNGTGTALLTGIKPVYKYSIGFANIQDDTPTNAYRTVETIWPPSASELNLATHTTAYDYFTSAYILDSDAAAKAPQYFLGLTNLVTDENNQYITVGLRDYSSKTSYPDLVRMNNKNTKLQRVIGDSTLSYTIFGFCT